MAETAMTARRSVPGVSRTKLAKAVASETGIGQKAAFHAVGAVFREIETRLAAGERVVVANFGSFTPVERPERPFVIPGTGERGVAPARRAVRFLAAAGLKRAVNAETEA